MKKIELISLISLLLVGFFMFSCKKEKGNDTKDGIPTDGLVGKYSFTGNANNEIINYANGIVYGATLTNDRFGASNSAYHFQLTSDHISVSNDLFNNNEISISIWAKADGLTSNCMLMLAPDDWNDRCVICAQYTGKPTYIIWDFGDCSNNGRTLINGPDFSSDWHHYVFMTSQSQNLKKIYMDGTCLKSENFKGSLNNFSRDIYIGGGTDWSGGGMGFKGSLDDIRIYNRPLTDAEVVKLYNESQ